MKKNVYYSLIDILNLKIMGMRNILAYPESPINEYDINLLLEISDIFNELSKYDDFTVEERNVFKEFSKLFKYSAEIVEDSYGLTRLYYASTIFNGKDNLNDVIKTLETLHVRLVKKQCCVEIVPEHYRYTDFILNVILVLSSVVKYVLEKIGNIKKTIREQEELFFNEIFKH